jgi:hypothetical protein
MYVTNTNSISALPAPCRALTELPDQQTVDAAGIGLPLEMARLVSCVIFRQAARGRSKSRSTIHETIMALVFLGRQPVERNGEVQPAPFPDLATSRWPQGREVFRRLGITNRDLEAYCRSARQRADDACLPLEWALALVPAAIWPMVAKVIEWGPEQVALRMEWAVTAMAQTTTQRDRRRRPAGSPLSLSTIDHRVTGLWQMLGVLLELRSIAATSPVLPLAPLDGWTVKPRRIDPRDFGAREAGQDNSGPSVEVCATRLRELAAEAATSRRGEGYLKRRRVLLMALLCLFGGRADAFRTTRVEDYLPNHRYPDGMIGPVLRIFPAKTWDPDEAHYLPLPSDLAGWIESWIGFTGRQIGQLDEPLFPSRKPKPGRPNQPLTEHGFFTAVAGARQPGGTGSRPLLPMGDDPYLGWRVHAYRHTAYQAATQAAANLQHEDSTFFPHIHPQEFAKAIVGHHLVRDVGAIYRDLDRQLLSRAVVDEMWRVLYDDGVRRRGPDPNRVRRAREQRDALQLTITALGHHIRDLEARAAQAADRLGGARDESRRIQLQLQAAELRLDANAQRDELRRHEDTLAQADGELADATATLVPIPDHISNAEHARQLADALGRPGADVPVTPPVRLADELTIRDAAELFGVDAHSIGRWRNHGFPRHRPLPWYGGEEAWHDHTQKDRRLRVGAINVDGLTEPQRQMLEQLRLGRALADSSDPGTAQVVGPSVIDGQLDAWETSGASPPHEPVAIQEYGE